VRFSRRTGMSRSPNARSKTAIMTKEVQGLRSEHNFAPETAIRDVAIALRRNLDQAVFDRVLATVPQGATQFWQL